MPNVSRHVTILHTNDFHNHLTAAQAEVLKRAKEAAGPNTLLLDAGDAISAGNVGVRPGGEPILTLMSDAGYDAMTLGNRETHLSEAVLRHKIGNARFPLLSANMRFKSEKSDVEMTNWPVLPNVIKTLPNGARVGVLGVTVPMVTERMAARHLSAFLFDEPLAVARAQAASLRPQVDLLIALTHIGIRADEQLAASCPNLDLLITGHTHLTVRHGDKPGGVPIVQAAWFGHYFGRVDFELAAETDGRPRIAGSEILDLATGTAI